MDYWLGIFGSIASIVSLAIAVLAWRKASEVEKKFAATQDASQAFAVNSPVTQTMTFGDVNRG